MKALVSYCDCSTNKKWNGRDTYFDQNEKQRQQWTRQAHETAAEEKKRQQQEKCQKSRLFCVKLDDDDST